MEGLSEAQVAVYDRQLRVWGKDTQQRLAAAKILIVGCSGVGAEIAKNVALAGVGSVTLLDDATCGEGDPGNFLVPDSAEPTARVSEVSASTLRDMNPLIDVSVVGGDVAGVDLEGFAVAVAAALPLASVAALDERCRAEGVAFFAADCRAWLGWAFADLGERSWNDEREIQERGETHKVATEASTSYPSWTAALAADLSGRNLRRTHPAYFLLRALVAFESEAARVASSADAEALVKRGEVLCGELGLPEGLPIASDARAYLQHPLGLPAVAAVLGGVVSNDVLKAISGKGEVIDNFFFFSAADGAGIVERFGKP